MQFRSLLWLLSASLITTLLQGCSGSGGGPSHGSPRHKHHHGHHRHKCHHKHHKHHKQHRKPDSQDKVTTITADGLNPEQRRALFQNNSVDSIIKEFPIPDGLSSAQQSKLTNTGKSFLEAYKNNSIDNLPAPDDLLAAAYIDQTQGKNISSLDLEELIALDDFDGFIKAMEAVTEDLRQNNPSLPSISKQNILTRSGHHQWQLHFKTMVDIRKHMNGEYRFNDLKDDMPMVADASGNNVLITGLKHDEWYFYSQGYAFRGHWQPDTDTHQDYSGHGMELGVLKTIDSGWAFGGMFGVQKVKMEANQSKADAMVYRVGPFVSWSDDRWSLDTMLSYGWVNMNTQTGRWSGAPKGSEWAGHVQGTYTIPLDSLTMGLKLIPEAYAGYRVGNIEAHDEKNGGLTRKISASKQTGLTTRLGSGLNYTFPDLRNPTDVTFRAGLEKTFMWQKSEQDRSSHWPKTPNPESRDTAIYYGLGFNHQFGADLNKLIGIDYMGTAGRKSGSDALTFTYRQRF